MGSAFRHLWTNVAIEIALKATFFAFFATSALIVYICIRRYFRRRMFEDRDARAFEIRCNWEEVVSLGIPPERWRKDRRQRELVESMLLDRIDVAKEDELEVLVDCYRRWGLLDQRIFEVRNSRGRKRQHAIASLARSRNPEAIAALSEVLDSAEAREVTSAVRGLGRIGIPEAAIPILDRIVETYLTVADVPLKTSLVNCCRGNASLILQYMKEAEPYTREVLARTLAEVISPDCAEDLYLFSQDRSPEVRASVARALGHLSQDFAAPLLFTMTMDEVWYVRLRAVTSLGMLNDLSSIEALVRCLCDTNRVVRQRAAVALVQFKNELPSILRQVITTGDKYGLHSYISELQRSGQYADLVRELQSNPARVGYPELMDIVERTSSELGLAAQPSVAASQMVAQ